MHHSIWHFFNYVFISLMPEKETLLKHSAKSTDDNWKKKKKEKERKSIEWFEVEFKTFHAAIYKISYK